MKKDVRLRRGALRGDNHGMRIKSLATWEPLVKELDIYLQKGVYIHEKDIAKKHGLKPGSFRNYLKRNYPEKIKAISLAKKTRALEKKKKEAAKVKSRIERRKYEYNVRLAQCVFDMDDGMGMCKAAVKNGFRPEVISRLLKSKGLTGKYVTDATYDEEVKAKAFELRDQGLTLRAIASEIKVAKSSVWLWCKQRGLNVWKNISLDFSSET